MTSTSPISANDVPTGTRAARRTELKSLRASTVSEAARIARDEFLLREEAVAELNDRAAVLRGDSAASGLDLVPTHPLPFCVDSDQAARSACRQPDRDHPERRPSQGRHGTPRREWRNRS